MSFEAFEEFLAQSFAEGIYSRELRLSKDEARFVAKRYPKAHMKKHAGTESQDGKSWYEIELASPAPASVTAPSTAGGVRNDLEQENLRLKREIDHLKKSLADVGMLY